jgi:hypothetical protein
MRGLGVSDVVKMYQGGVGKEIIVAYIETTVLPFHLTADGEIYLQHLEFTKICAQNKCFDSRE